jgi:hypothetical protein
LGEVISFEGDLRPKFKILEKTPFFLSVGLFRGELEVDLLLVLPGKNMSVHELLRFDSGFGDFEPLASGIANNEL